MEALRKIRGIAKAKLTKLERKIENELSAGQLISKARIEVYLARLDEIHTEFDDVQRKITIDHGGEPTVVDMSEEEDHEERYLNLKIKLREISISPTVPKDEAHVAANEDALARVLRQQNEMMQQLTNNGGVGIQAPAANSDAVTQLIAQQTELLRRFTDDGGIARNESNVKLPVVKLPTFDGRIEDWKRFSETFQSLIHNNETISVVQKFQYLITSLSGTAAKIIESIELTSNNYVVAWNLLTKRYDDPRAIRKRHIQCLFNMPRVEKEASNAIRELVDYTMKHLRILKSMGLPTESWNELIIHMIEARLDNATLRAWEQSRTSSDATLENLIDFLETRCQALERIEARTKQKDVTNKAELEKQQVKPRVKGKPGQFDKSSTLATSVGTGKCFLCQGNHFVYRCDKFIAMPVDERVKEVQRLKLCVNCLRNDHLVKSCRMGPCRECPERHNTLLHAPDKRQEVIVNASESSSNSKTSSNVSVHHASNCPQTQGVIMATAVVNAIRSNGSSTCIRILLDSASEANFVTQATCTKLGVKRNRTSGIVTGLNDMASQISQSCNIVIQSRHSNYQVNVRCLVVPSITKNLPSVELTRSAIQTPSNVKLADAEFYKQSAIDMLVGAEFFFDLLEAEKIELGNELPSLRNTKLGWVIAGTVGFNRATSLACTQASIATLHCAFENDETLNQSLERFWEIETVPSEANPKLSASERECEEFFEQTTTRDGNGRFVVRLPFRKDPNQLGESRASAIRRLTQLERRFAKNPLLHKRYVEFMREYEALGHMSAVTDIAQDNSQPIIYLPHHGIVKESSSSTKLRTVFDASCKTDSGLSLNDVLHVGPTLQSSLNEIVVRFRFHNIALTGDLCKMYRQVVVHPDDRDFQRIVWRESPDKPIRQFRLNTVTYGQASSSYLAIKCVRRLAEQSQNKYSIAARVVLDAMYVDDIMTGSSDVQGVIETQRQLTALLQTGGFEAHKWCSSRTDDTSDRPRDETEDVSTHVINSEGTIKTLGLEWSPHDDNFRFSVQEIGLATTKRQILSIISKFFDPLGLIGPILTSAKLLMQQTWSIGCDWDEPLPTTFVQEWENFRQGVNAVKTFLIPRRVISCDKPIRVFLQGFCDASEGAYGACLYIQAEDEHGNLTTRLLCSKARVAPTKPLSIPPLELCSAVLLTRLVASVQRALRIRIDGLQAWSDSTVTLCWIRGEASRWKVFVANRVSEITQTIEAKQWGHVKGDENPADLISRGTSPSVLKDSELWWSGPSWLKQKPPTFHAETNSEPSGEIIKIVKSEERRPILTCNFLNEKSQIVQEIVDKYSSFGKIERVLAYCLRFIANLRKRKGERTINRISVAELREAHLRIIKQAQTSEFSEEISALERCKPLKTSSKLLPLHPFLDENGVLRVGGRLQHASLPFERKHQILLPTNHRATRLLFEREHLRLLHASQLLLLSSLRERYWPLKGRNLARQVCRTCVRCARNEPRETSQLMGSLPFDRVRPSRAFTATGIDFAGPLLTLANKGRGRKTNKSYIAIFVCYSTRAVHLEATTELTSAAFIATLRRFISRRGRPRTIYSDNATNFVGAQRELKEVYKFVRSQVDETIGNLLANENIEWKFIPPGSPHMGGLWESAVKSCKYHLKRIMGNTLFTFEELSTALTQIEACLNSRPISAVSTDPEDLQPLTPAHFLVGESLTSLPDVDVQEVPLNRLSRWEIIQKCRQDFWRRWESEYLQSLQGRTKWRTTQSNLKVADLVVLRDEHLPPCKWRLGASSSFTPGTMAWYEWPLYDPLAAMSRDQSSNSASCRLLQVRNRKLVTLIWWAECLARKDPLKFRLNAWRELVAEPPRAHASKNIDPSTAQNPRDTPELSCYAIVASSLRVDHETSRRII